MLNWMKKGEKGGVSGINIYGIAILNSTGFLSIEQALFVEKIVQSNNGFTI